MPLVCNECDEEFDSSMEAKEHVKDKHADVCDEHLQEYVDDSVNDAYEELIEGEEGEEDDE